METFKADGAFVSFHAQQRVQAIAKKPRSQLKAQQCNKHVVQTLMVSWLSLATQLQAMMTGKMSRSWCRCTTYSDSLSESVLMVKICKFTLKHMSELTLHNRHPCDE